MSNSRNSFAYKTLAKFLSEEELKSIEERYDKTVQLGRQTRRFPITEDMRVVCRRWVAGEINDARAARILGYSVHKLFKIFALIMKEEETKS